jgi:hypothetical protein
LANKSAAVRFQTQIEIPVIVPEQNLDNEIFEDLPRINKQFLYIELEKNLV